MRIAIVADIHGNRSALEAVLADLRVTSPDLVLHGGDLADSGASPAEVVDRVRELGWPGVLGNTDEMLVQPASLQEFASRHPAFRDLFSKVEEMAAATREALGEERLDWLRGLPRMQRLESVTLVHGTPETPWRAPGAEAADEELRATYGPLESPVAVFAHTHTPFVRTLPGLTVANAGSVGLPYDGDPRASYLLLDGLSASIRRVAYDTAAEARRLCSCPLPHAFWVAKLVESGRFSMP